MSTIPGRFLDEGFARELYVRALTTDEVALVLQAWEPFRERIEYLLGEYDEETQSWRAYRNACFDWLPDPLKPAVTAASKGPGDRNPADNSGGCEVCGLDRQVRGCTPGKCRGGAGFAIVHAPVRPDARFVANPGDLFNGHPLSSFCEECRLGILEIGRAERVEFTFCAACTAMLARSAHPPPKTEMRARAAAPEHPLPWRWVNGADGPGGAATALIDSTGIPLLHSTDSLSPPEVDFASAHVRAVTERAGAMEQSLRRMVERAFPRMADGELGRCIYCASIGGPPQARHYPECPVPPAAALLAEIDAAKVVG